MLLLAAYVPPSKNALIAEIRIAPAMEFTNDDVIRFVRYKFPNFKDLRLKRFFYDDRTRKPVMKFVFPADLPEEIISLICSTVLMLTMTELFGAN